MTHLKTMLTALSALLITGLLFSVAQPPRSAAAHPLGNFSVNRLVLIDFDVGEGLTLRYIINAAELPAFQALRSIDTDGDGALSGDEESAYLAATAEGILDRLVLEVDGERVPLTLVAAGAQLLEGQAGLQTMRTVIDARGELPAGWTKGVAASFRDENYGGEPGWRQIVVRPGAALRIEDAATIDVTRELTEYPKDLLKSPPAVSAVAFSLRAGASVPAVEPLSESETVSRDAAGRTLGRFASFVSRENVTPGVLVVALLLAAAWGAMHALGPGHGKTVVAAYLIGERGTWRHAVYLGLIVTATHTISVFALGAIAIFAADVLPADDVYYWLSVASGALVAALGGLLLVTRARRLRGPRAHTVQHHHEHHGDVHHHGDDHHPEHEHAHEHGHSHVPASPGWRGLVALGVSGGMVPCPTALVVMLGAIAVERTVYGLVLVTAFSAGLAGVLTGVGLLMVYGRRLIAGSRARPLAETRLVRSAMSFSPLLSALGILAVGLVLTSRVML